MRTLSGRFLKACSGLVIQAGPWGCPGCWKENCWWRRMQIYKLEDLFLFAEFLPFSIFLLQLFCHQDFFYIPYFFPSLPVGKCVSQFLLNVVSSFTQGQGRIWFCGAWSLHSLGVVLFQKKNIKILTWSPSHYAVRPSTNELVARWLPR